MKRLGKIVLHIPAREGSKRVPRKNMRLMNGHPMISYTINATIEANVTPYMYVNTDSQEIIDYVQTAYEAMKIYKRDAFLASDQATSEDFNQDIIKKLQPDTLMMINPVCPLIEPKDITDALTAYKESDCDTLITSTSTQMQTFCEEKPVNIRIDEKLAATQNNPRIYILNWAITIWDAKKFTKRMEKFGYASLGEKRLLFDIEPQKAVKVSEEKDFIFAELLLKNLKT